MKSYTLKELEEKESLNEEQAATGEMTSGNNETYHRGMNPASLANLRPWPKGTSGNPLGRPYKLEQLKEALNEVGGEQNFWNEDITNREKVLNVIWEQASYGDLKFIQMLAALGCLDKKHNTGPGDV